MRKTLLLLLTATFALTTGCGSSAYLFSGGRPQLASSPHPAKGGIQGVPMLAQDQLDEERYRALPPQTLRSQAQITVADAQQLCINVIIRGLDNAAYADLRNWAVTFRSVGQGAEAVPVEDEAPNIELIPAQAQQFQGNVPQQVQVGTRTVCAARNEAGTCVRNRSEPVYQTQYVPGVMLVATGGGNICFANTEHLTLDTKSIALRLNARRNIRSNNTSGPERLTFQWDFTGAAAAPAPQQQQAQPQQQQAQPQQQQAQPQQQQAQPQQTETMQPAATGG